MKNQKIEWFSGFRKELFELCKILGIDEIIYLADQGAVLGKICHSKVWMNWPYARIKEEMMRELSPPTPLHKARTNEDSADRQWFMDDFSNLK